MARTIYILMLVSLDAMACGIIWQLHPRDNYVYTMYIAGAVFFFTVYTMGSAFNLHIVQVYSSIMWNQE